MIQYMPVKVKMGEVKKKTVMPLLFRILIIFRVRIKITAHKNIRDGIFPGACSRIGTSGEEIVFPLVNVTVYCPCAQH